MVNKPTKWADYPSQEEHKTENIFTDTFVSSAREKSLFLSEDNKLTDTVVKEHQQSDYISGKPEIISNKQLGDSFENLRTLDVSPLFSAKVSYALSNDLLDLIGSKLLSNALTSSGENSLFQNFLSSTSLLQTYDFLLDYRLSGMIERYDFNAHARNENSTLSERNNTPTSGLTFSATIGNDFFVGTKYSDTVLYDGDGGFADNGDTDIINLYGGSDIITADDAYSFGLNSVINMGSGDDVITSTNNDIALRFNAQIFMGSGNDHFNLDTNVAFFYELDLYNNSLLDMGAGDDILDAGYLFYMFNSAVVTTGSGDDTVNSGQIELYDVASLNTGIGNDIINASNYIDMNDTSEIDTGAGDDTVTVVNGIYLDGDSNFYMGDGNDSVTFTTFGLYMRNNLSIFDMGDGDDTFTNNDEVTFQANSQLLMGAGDDTLNVAGNISGTGEVHMGTGDDTIILNGSGNKLGLYGDADADTFLFTGIGGTVEIEDFSVAENDVLDISQILIGYDPMIDLLSDFVRFTDVGPDLLIEVDVDGGADSFATLATIIGNAGLDADTLETNGHLDTVI